METININKASAKELEKLIHIGPARSAEIISKRPFKDVYELSNIPSIGKKRMNDLLTQGLASV